MVSTKRGFNIIHDKELKITCSNSSNSTSPSPFKSNILNAISKTLGGARCHGEIVKRYFMSTGNKTTYSSKQTVDTNVKYVINV